MVWKGSSRSAPGTPHRADAHLGTRVAGHCAGRDGSGGSGFLSKSLSIGQVLRAIHTVLDGGVSWPTSSQSLPAAEPDTAPAAGSPGPAAASHGLTLRQLEVLSLLGRGNSNAEIAEDLGISERTAKAHMKAIFDALGVDTRVKAVIRAREWGLLG